MDENTQPVNPTPAPEVTEETATPIQEEVAAPVEETEIPSETV